MNNVEAKTDYSASETTTVPVQTTCQTTTVQMTDDVPTTKAEKQPPAFFTLIRKYASVSDVLRISGAFAVAVAMGLFLLEGVDVANDLFRFMTMLGLTTALTGAGLLMSMVLKEQRGSRLFIGLGLLSIPVNFTVFGALLYSIVPLDTMSVSYPGFAHWQVTNISQVPLAIVSGVAVLLPVVWLGYTVLARSARNWLSGALLLGSLFLIIPVRHELAAAALSVISAVTMWWFTRSKSKNSLALRTAEGRFAIALLFVAPVIVAVRSLFLYEASGILLLTICGGLYFYVRHLLTLRSDKNFISAALTVIAAIAAVCVSMAGADILSSPRHPNNEWATIASAIAMMCLTIDLHKVAPRGKFSTVVTSIMTLTATTALFALCTFGSFDLITLSSLGILVVVATYSFIDRQHANATITTLGALAIGALHVEELWQSIAQTGWWGIAAGGAAAIVAGSMLDRAGTVVKFQSQTGSKLSS